jgi:hypothetical protein
MKQICSRMIRRRAGTIAVGALVVATLASAGCAGHAGSSADAKLRTVRPSVSNNLSVLRRVEYDHVVFESPAALAEFVDVVVSGSVEGFARGWELDTADLPEPDRYVIMSVRVDHLLKGPAGSVKAGRIYVNLPQGVLDTIGDFRKTLPSGTSVVLFLQRVRPDKLAGPGDRVIGWGRGHPAGSMLYQPFPQGMILERRHRIIGGIEDLAEHGPQWGQALTLDEFVSRLTAQIRIR